jgi:hypothetical protein
MDGGGFGVKFSAQGQEMFVFSIMSRSVLGPTEYPVQWVLGAVFPGVKRQVLEADH